MSESEDPREQVVSLAERDAEALRRYRQRFTRRASARAYGERFRTRKRVTNRFEGRALGRALSSLGELGRVLDVPAGVGRFFPLLRERAAEVVGADVSVEMLQLARAGGLAAPSGAAESQAPGAAGPSPAEGLRPAGGTSPALVQADVLALPFAEGSFDTVVCIRFLHHLPSGRLRIAGLRELARVSSRYVVVSFFDYASVWALRQAWRHLRGKVNPGAIPLARFQAEAAQAGLRFLRSVHVLAGLSEEQVLVFEKDPAVASAAEEAPQSVSRRLRAGHWLNATGWLWTALLGGLIFLCRWREMENAGFLLWPSGIVLMLAGGALLMWTYRCRRTVSGQLGRPSPDGRGPYALSRHPALLGVTLWLCGFALTCELWWMGLAVWVAVPGGLWLAMEYAEAQRWLHHGHAYDLYAQGTPFFLPSVRVLWWKALSAATPAPSTSPGEGAGLWCGVGVRAVFATAAGAALALLKELSFS